MTTNRQVCVCCLFVACLAAAGGCAGGPGKNSPGWLNLPSPWTTIKNTEKKAAAVQPPPASTPPASSVSKRTPAGKSPPRGKAPQQGSESLAMTLLRGRNCERNGEWDKARQIYEGLLKDHPGSIEVVHRLGVVADAQRRHAEAEQLFLFALQHQPRSAALLSDLGYCYYLQGQLAKAESALVKATLLEPSSPRHWNNLGLVVGHLGRHQEALEHFRKSGPEADAQYNLAFLFASQNRVEEAKACFQAALASDPAHRRAREALTSFEEYDRLPAHLRDLHFAARDGVRYVPYIESPELKQAGIAPVAAQEGLATSQTASRTARQLHVDSRGMLDRNMASQRTQDAAAP